MNHRLTTIMSLLLLLLATPPVLAEGAGIEWDILNREVLELYRTGKYGRAVVVVHEALEVAEKKVGPDHRDVAMSLNNLAALYEVQGHYALAEPLYRRALTIDEKALGPNHPDVATTLTNLAVLYYSQGQNAQAEVFYQRALAITENTLGPDHPIAKTIIASNDATKELLDALEQNDMERAARAVESGANTNIILAGRPLLFYATRNGELSEVRFLLDHGADIGATTAYGRSALHEATLYGYPEIVQLLIERGADVNARNPRRETPLFYAEEDLIAEPPRTESHAKVAAILRENGGIQ